MRREVVGYGNPKACFIPRFVDRGVGFVISKRVLLVSHNQAEGEKLWTQKIL